MAINQTIDQRLDGILLTILKGADDQAREESVRLTNEFIARGMGSSSDLIGSVVEALDKIHAASIGQAIGLVNHIAGKMNVSSKETTDWVRSHLENLGSALLVQIPAAGFPNEQQRLRAQYAIVFQQRLDTALQDVGRRPIEGSYNPIPPPEIPPQGYGPHFEISDDGIITFAPPEALDREGNNVARLKKLHPTLRSLSSDLVKALQKGNIAHPYLRDRAEAYRELIDRDIEHVNFALLYSEGLRLANAEKAARDDKDLPPLSPHVRETVDSLLCLHGPFMLATAEGIELIAAEEHFKRTPQEVFAYRIAMLGLADTLQNKPGVIDPRVASFVHGAVEQIDRGNNRERSGTVAAGTVQNLIIILLTTATLYAVSASAAASGSAALIVSTGAVVLLFGKGLEKSKPFATMTALVSKGFDKASETEFANALRDISQRFKQHLKLTLEAEPWLRALANQRDGGLKWVEGLLDWIKNPTKKQPDSEVSLRGDIAHPGSRFLDFTLAPEMIVVPAGEFLMGSLESREAGRERPLHKVTIARPFAVGRFAVTFDEWDWAYGRGGVKHNPKDAGWGRGRRPVVNVSWEDAKAYVGWLSQETGKAYRLLSEAEWEYCCRAGTTTEYSFGDVIDEKQAQFSDSHSVEVGSFSPNAWGLYDMHGNVWEWCEDNWHENYRGAPRDGSVWEGGDASSRVLRGGSWILDPILLRSANRFGLPSSIRHGDVGFRVARTL